MSRYLFEADSRPLDLEVILLYRRAFHNLMEQKGWNTPDILMERYRARL